jgi:AraC-like DNA-binding protein
MTELSSHLVGPLLRYALERGERIPLADFGLSEDAYAQDAAQITNPQLGRLFDAMAARLGEPHLGLVLPGQLRFQRYAVPELAARASATLRGALEEWAHFASLVHPSIAFECVQHGSAVHFSHRTLGFPRGLSRHLNEFAMAAPLHFGRESSGASPRVLEVSFAHARPRSLDALQTYFRTRALQFGADHNRLVLDGASLEQPQLTADARLLATVRSLGELALAQRGCAEPSLRAQVARQLRAQLEVGDVHLRKLARLLHLSVRTLQRRLEDEGTSFAAVLDEVKRELACALVSDPELPLHEVAARLGFGEVASFSRAFKRWTGHGPGAYRSRA